MESEERAQLNELMRLQEDMWTLIDTVFTNVAAADAWDRKHGADWILADVPYHLAYVDRDLIARPLEFGEEMPPEEQIKILDLGSWNEAEFAKRPQNQTPAESVTEMKATWDDIRRIVAGFTDADLERMMWQPLVGMGWIPFSVSLSICRNHEYSEFLQARIHLGDTEPVPSVELTDGYLASMTGSILQFFVDQDAAADKEIVAAFNFTDAGVSPKSIRVINGIFFAEPDISADAELVLKLDSVTFEKRLRQIQSFKIKRQNPSRRGKFRNTPSACSGDRNLPLRDGFCYILEPT